MFKHKRDYKLYYNLFLESSFPCEEWEIGIVGVPLDITTSNKSGTRFAPDEIRSASWSIETYIPYLNKDISSRKYVDLGNIELSNGNLELNLQIISSFAEDYADKKMVYIGGEHLITLPIFARYAQKYVDICLIQLDAHADLRYEYLGAIYSHATVMYHCLELISPDRFFQLGIRSGTMEEFELCRKYETIYDFSHKNLEKLKRKIGERPVYLSIDVDVFDPSLCPATGTPECGGIFYTDYLNFLNCLRDLNVVAFDVVELSPHYDITKSSSTLCAKIIRDTMANFWYE